MAAVAARFASPLARTARTWAPGLARDAAAATGTRMASGGHALPSKTDFCVVGGGIIGVAIARELAHRHPGASITLLEKESSVAQHASGRNSGVLHAGFYYSPESFKAKLTRAGNVFLHEYIEEKGLKINKCGKIVVARNEEEAAGIDELKRRGDANGVPLEKITAAEAEELEPLVRTHEVALWSPTTSAADPEEVTRSLARDAEEAGVTFIHDTRYVGGGAEGRVGNGCVVRTNHGTLEAGHLVNCAGLYADRVAHDFGFGKDLVMLPFKGLYMYCNSVPLTRLIYPVPDLRNPFLGVHFTVTVDGKVKIGPTAIPALWREQYGLLDNMDIGDMYTTLMTEAQLFVKAGFNFRELAFEEARKYYKPFMTKGASELVKGVTDASFGNYGRPGIRAQLLDKRTRTLVMDFHIEGDESSTHVLNAVSPAWTCSVPLDRKSVV